MSAKKANSILNYFTKTPTSSGQKKKPLNESCNNSSPVLESKKQPKEYGDCLKADKTLEEQEVEELARMCVEDDEEDQEEPKKKRKRILVLDSDSDDDATWSPKKQGKKEESDIEEEEFEEDDIEEDVEVSEEDSSPDPPPRKKSKTKCSPAGKENKSNVKDKLANFASPTLNKSKSRISSIVEEDSSGSSPCILTFPHLSFKFLDPKLLMDKHKRRPDDPEYDPATVYVPESFLKDQTPAQRQWWTFKVDHYDTILFFKMGKFYELFHMDAVLAVERCGLLYMKKEMAHCGFPEVAFERYADVLVNLGYKVARIEQTETPADMEVRCKSMNRPTKFDKVVRREICQISTIGTRIGDGGSDTSYLTAMCGLKVEGKLKVGLCFVDTSMGEIQMGQFYDDNNLSKLETTLAVYPPSEVLYDRNKCPPAMVAILDKFSATKKQALNRHSNFPEAKRTLKLLHDQNYFGPIDEKYSDIWPAHLLSHLDQGDPLGHTPDKDGGLVLSALGAVVMYLQEALIDHYVLSMKNMRNLQPIDLERQLSDDSSSLPPGSNMIMDNKTLKNLDIVSCSGPSLFSVLDKTSTAMGKRLLKQWTCMPLLRIQDIEDRQEALRYLHNSPSLVSTLKEGLKGMPDLEKLVSAIHTAGVKLSNHPECRAIYYEQPTYAAKKISRLLVCLEHFTKAKKMLTSVQSELVENRKSSVLKQLLMDEEDGGGFPCLTDVLSFFKKGFDHKEAEKLGKIIPQEGVDEAYDECKQMRRDLENDVDAYLRQQKKHFGADVKFWGSGNNAYQLEVPEHAASKAGREHMFSSQKKGWKRFVTDQTKEFLARQAKVDESEAVALSEVSRNIFCKFSSSKDLWDKAIRVLALADVLLSLLDYSYSLDDDSCFPAFQKARNNKAHLKVVSGRHPIVIAVNPNESFIPNAFQLDDRLAILTGANMGGKSTLMRQTALLSVLAQMGCRVPAVEMSLTPVDRIFTRIGASDNIFERESTFFVELSETSIILKYANSHSLVLIDELGRGTTTFDGCAIAHAVAKFLTTKRCRTIFSTHYHELTREYVNRNDVIVYHMSVIEEEAEQEDAEKAIVFLYTVAPGACSKSHGFNAARLAGLPSSIIENGRKIADKFEQEQKNLLELSHILETA